MIPLVAETKTFQKPFDTKNTFFLLLRLLLYQKDSSLCATSQSVSLGSHPGADKRPLRAQGSRWALRAFTAHSLLTGHALTIPPCTLFIYRSPLPPKLYWLLLLTLCSLPRGAPQTAQFCHCKDPQSKPGDLNRPLRFPNYKKPTNFSKPTPLFFTAESEPAKTRRDLKCASLLLAKYKYRDLISFTSVVSSCPPRLSSLLNLCLPSDNGHGRTFGDNRFITGTGNCSAHSTRALSPLPESLLWGSSWPQEERQPSIYSTYKWQKIAHEILLSCKKVKMTTPNKLAEERADRAKSLQCPSATWDNSDQPQHNQTLINFLSPSWRPMFAAHHQMVVPVTLAVLWGPRRETHVLPSQELAKTEGAQQTGPGRSGFVPLAASGDSKLSSSAAHSLPWDQSYSRKLKPATLLLLCHEK